MKPICFWIVTRLPALLKPRMLIGTMTRHDVNHHLKSEPMRLGNQRVKIRQAAVFRVDVAVIGDIIAEILLRRRVERADPNRINPEIGNILKPRGNPRQIADAVGIGILKRTGIDLVNNGGFPPFEFSHNQPPFTEPASSPRMKYRCIDRKTTTGTIMEITAEAFSKCS